MENGSQNTKHLKINRNVNEKKKLHAAQFQSVQ